MRVGSLKALLRPRSVAVIGASNRPYAPGQVVMRNLLRADFGGPVLPVTAEDAAVAGVLAYPDIAALPSAPDLALVCTPAATLPGVIRALGARGARAACVMTPIPGQPAGAEGRGVLEAALAEAKAAGMRLLGPDSMGVLVPGIGLNASLAPEQAVAGRIAFVSQSGALCSAVLDWASSRRIGFSHFIHLGSGADIGFGDVLDYLGSDPTTRAILLYLETIGARRNFMSAARAAARNKPVLVIRAGRSADGARAATSHTGAMAGADAVFDAAIRRAGMLRVADIEQIFSAVETLARARPVTGERLAVLTNGGGLGVIAADDFGDGGGHLAELSETALARLGDVLPPVWSRGDPVDIGGDADGERYAKALGVLLDSKEVDAVLVIHSPTALADATRVAEAVVAVAKERPRANVMACWVGHETVEAARALFAEAALPSFETPRAAVESFLHLLRYRRNQEMLIEVPPSAPVGFAPDTAAARALVRDALARGAAMLPEPDAKAMLRAYGIPAIDTRAAATPAEAAAIAAAIGGPLALKILSPDILHKSEAGGVMLNLDPGEVETAAAAMLARVRRAFPAARIDGVTVQRMAARRPGALELIVGIATDPVFGPVVLFGQGGVAAEAIGDRAVALPPLNLRLAAGLVDGTRVSRLLRGHGGAPPADADALLLTLIQVSQMVVDIPELAEMDINPLLCDSRGVVALDARIRLAQPRRGDERLAIRPYPAELEERFTMAGGRPVLLRPIRPEDEPNHHVFISKLSEEDIRFRFFGHVHELPHSEMARLTQIDYDREMAFIAEGERPDGAAETLGVVRTVTDPDNDTAEFAIVVRSDLKGSGLGKRLLTKMVEYCRSRGTRAMTGQVLRENSRMLDFVEHLGFRRGRTIDGDIVEVDLELR
ncbi:MAG: bifunctional acetate--CoA ligase family protein/GNAT family N-acetyltransferase [Magnetospirillum sp.]|nr:bifunctional acetate--CoA ligase family protein/GNAT family N-acetyltransferase [Magnetospirillum sp.]